MRRIPGDHAPNAKNRSSKQLVGLTKHKSIYRCVSNAQLNEMVGTAADAEKRRRAKRREKKENKAAS